MNNLTSDCIAIDTNIFEHLLNPQNNISNHIETLLNKLAIDNVHLIIDTGGRIWGEYTNRITNKIRNTKNPNHEALLRYWLKDKSINKVVNVNQNDNLMVSIKSVIRGDKATDRIFVYIAIHENQVLVTNDKNDILDGGNIKYERRKKLLKIARRQSFKSAEIYDSQEAYDKL